MKLLVRVWVCVKGAKSSDDDVYAEKLLNPPKLSRRIELCGVEFSESTEDFALLYDVDKDVYAIDITYLAPEIEFKRFVSRLRSIGFEGLWPTEAE